MTLIYLPGDAGIKLRSICYKPFFKSCGKRVYIDSGVHLKGMKYMNLGSDIHIDKNCIIQAGPASTGIQKKIENNSFSGKEGELLIGNQVHIVQNCMLFAFGGIKIGNQCTLSASTKVYSQSNIPYDPDDKGKIVSIMPYNTANFIIGPVVLMDNVWLGLNCIVMPGSTIEKNSFAQSFSLIKGNFSENSYLGGQPAKKLRSRFE
ncbi:MAG: hypothetical protein WDZ35_05045 [Crocinitomicaceae bacterium]